MAAGVNTCTVRFTWSTTGAAGASLWYYNLDAGTSGIIAAGANNPGLDINWISADRRIFKLHETSSSSSAVLATSPEIKGVRQSGDLSWNSHNPSDPNSCVITTGSKCRVTFSWMTKNAPNASVWVKNLNTNSEGIMSSGASGEVHADWIDTVPRTFTLRAANLLTSPVLEVSPVIKGSLPVPSAVISVKNAGSTNVTNCSLNQLKGSCTVYVSWSSSFAPSSTLWYTQIGTNVSEMIQSSASGSMKPIPWIGRSSYRFQVRNGNQATSQVLAESAAITAVEAGSPIVDPGYQVGVNYHATGSDFTNTAFINRYHQPAIRSTVLSQLQTMADAGVDRVFLRLFMIKSGAADNIDEAWRSTFPPTAQELANLRQYAIDVGNTTAPGQQRMRLDIAILWSNAAADYKIRTATTVGSAKLSTAEYSARAVTAYKTVIDAVDDLLLPGSANKIVESVYFDGEFRCGNTDTANHDWFIKTFYPGFVSYAKNAGITPTIYFLPSTAYETTASRNSIFRSMAPDPSLPILNGRPSMFNVYRCLKFMKDNNLHIPRRLDMSIYPLSTSAAGHIPVLDRVLDDADAVLPSLGITVDYGAAETYYFASSSLRSSLGAALKLQASNLRGNRLKRTWIWTTPYSQLDLYLTGTKVGIPASVSEYLP